jgi:general secretion pathway protein J
MRAQAHPNRAGQNGFTLIELMVAIGIMALMAILSWRGLDGMTRAQSQLQSRSNEVLTLQAGLGQWGADLDAMVQMPQVQPLDWDGRAFRLTRRSAPVVQTLGSASNSSPDASAARTPPGLNEAVLVVAWSRREIEGAGQWLRWQSAPLRTRGEVAAAWAQAAQWAQNPGDLERRREVRIAPLSQWQLFYYRGDAWSNPLSSNGVAPGTPVAPGAPLTADAAIPEGVRLVLTLPGGQAISGVLTKDWVRPTLGGGKS